MWNSKPSTKRRTQAILIMAFALATGLLLKIVRDYGILSMLLVLDAKGTSPNFIIPFSIPFAFLIGDKTISIREYSKNALGAATGITVYEFIQICMPSRTFDINDILASLIGAICSIVIAWTLFFRLKT